MPIDDAPQGVLPRSPAQVGFIRIRQSELILPASCTILDPNHPANPDGQYTALT